nr:3545_t:CDS:2 [Entrophospora candida]
MKIVNVLDDIGGSLSIAAKGLYSTGLSTDLNVSFINIAKKDDIVIMDAECVKLGKTLAHTIIELKNKNNENKLIAQGRHTKFVSIAHNDDKNIFKKN